MNDWVWDRRRTGVALPVNMGHFLYAFWAIRLNIYLQIFSNSKDFVACQLPRALTMAFTELDTMEKGEAGASITKSPSDLSSATTQVESTVGFNLTSNFQKNLRAENATAPTSTGSIAPASTRLTVNRELDPRLLLDASFVGKKTRSQTSHSSKS